jgi:hypothetical protein
MAQKKLRQKVTSKLLAVSKWRVKTPATLQQRQQKTSVKADFTLMFTGRVAHDGA